MKRLFVIAAIISTLFVTGCKDKPRQVQEQDPPRITEAEVVQVQPQFHYPQVEDSAGNSIGYGKITIEGVEFIQIQDNNAAWIKLH